MSFLFKSKKPSTDSALPVATRSITSAHGERTMIPTANGLGSPRLPSDHAREAHKSQTPQPGSSVSSSAHSLGSGSPEPIGIREISDSDTPASRAPQVATNLAGAVGPPVQGRPPGDSPYPWSQRRFNFSAQANPFPRYGAAVNSSASKEGWIYLMGGLINSTTVQGDLWMVESATSNMACYPVQTPSEGPGPRVGHASLLVGNAFIVFGGDTKLQDEDVLDDTLYLLNTASKQWSKALPAGPRPSGRYGHTLNILGSKIYVFGGQVEGFFFNDLVAFDLNGLQIPGNRWQMLIPNSKDGTNPAGPVPPPRTNHTCVTWQDKLYLFGGTDGSQWFNDVWTYDPRTNLWTELDCIGYIPAPREGHAAALVDDTMYIFGGRVQDGSDLGDLAAFRISSRRWYMFQNMGMSPSARSGHSMTAFGKNIIVLGGEPSSAPHDPKELSLCYVLDTSKIRYPPTEAAGAPASSSAPVAAAGAGAGGAGARKFSGAPGSGIPVKGGAPGLGGPQYLRDGPGTSLPRPGTAPAGSGPPPVGQAPQPRANGIMADGGKVRLKKGSKGDVDEVFENAAVARTMTPRGRTPSEERPGTVRRPKSPPMRRSMEGRPASGLSRNGSRGNRQQNSMSSLDHARGGSIDDARTASRGTEILGAVDSGIGSSPALSHQQDELLRELETARSRNVWYASELALARKGGYLPANGTSAANPLADDKAADMFGDDDRPMIEALLRMRSELLKVQSSIESQAAAAANRVAEVERQRDAAVNEAMYAKAKLAAHGGASDESRELATGTPDAERVADVHRRLASSLTTQNDLQTRFGKLTAELEAERRARSLAEDTAEAAEKRVADLDAFRQRAAGELETLRAELHESERAAREEAASSAEAVSAHRMLEVDHRELSAKHDELSENTRGHSAVLVSLQDAVTASTDKAALLEERLAEERRLRDDLQRQHGALRAEHETRGAALDEARKRLAHAEELADKHAAEARTHREAVLSGLSGRTSSRGLDESDLRDSRHEALQQQVAAANALVRKNQEAADVASEKLRRAEERIAGLEAYQEQSSREGLTMRKQLQGAMRDSQAAVGERAELQQQVERHRLESNALEVQLKTLKNLLEERGVSAADRRSRALDSPALSGDGRGRFGTPDQNRVRELEQQLEAAARGHEELRTGFEQREAESSREYNQKLSTLESDRQAAVKYVRGIEKMLAKMKQELQRTKGARDDLEKELAVARAAGAGSANSKEVEERFEGERQRLRAEMDEAQRTHRTNIAELEGQVKQLRSAVDAGHADAEQLRQRSAEQSAQHQQQLDALTERARTDLDHARRENQVLAERAKDAENKVQMFLDQFETSVDNYRRRSRMSMMGAAGGEAAAAAVGATAGAQPAVPKLNGVPARAQHGAHTSMSGESLYSNTTASGEDDDALTAGQITPSASQFPRLDGEGHGKGSHTASSSGTLEPGARGQQHGRDRSSTALDSLASELDALRTHWETTNKAYRLSDKFDFEHKRNSNVGGSADLGDSLADWRRRLDLDNEAEDGEPAGAVGGAKEGAKA